FAFDFLQGRFAEVANFEQLFFGSDHQVAHGGDAFRFEAVGRPHGKLELGEAHVELALLLHVDDVVRAGAGGVEVIAERQFGGRLGVLDERVQVFAEDLGAFDHGHLRRYRAVGPDLHHQAVVVGALADAGFLDLVLDAQHRREAGVDRDYADLALLARCLVRRSITAAVLDGHLHHERHVGVQRSQHVLGVDDLHVGLGDHVLALHDAALVAINPNRPRLVGAVLHYQALDVEDDVGDVLDDAGDRRDLVEHALDLDAGDGGAFEAGQQDAAEAITDGHAE